MWLTKLARFHRPRDPADVGVSVRTPRPLGICLPGPTPRGQASANLSDVWLRAARVPNTYF